MKINVTFFKNITEVGISNGGEKGYYLNKRYKFSLMSEGKSKRKIQSVYFDYERIKDCGIFCDKVRNIVKPGEKYAFLIKLKKDDGSWGMAGKHKIFMFNHDNFEKILVILHEESIELIEDYIEDYNYCGIDIIQLMIINVQNLPKLELNNINQLKLNKEIIRIGEAKRNFNSLILPFTMEKAYYGKRLLVIGNLNEIEDKDLEGNTLLRVLIGENIKYLENRFKNLHNLEFYNYTNKRGKPLLIVIAVKDNIQYAEVFDIYGNKVVSSIDTKLGEKEFIREIGNLKLRIKNNSIIRTEISGSLPTIKVLPIRLETTSNCNIGVFDLETYRDRNDNKSYVYALGFKVMNGDKKLFYISNEKSSFDIIIEGVNEILRSKYNGFIFYVHNLSGFDVIYLLNALVKYNNLNGETFNLKTVFKDDRIIKLTISKKDNKEIKISFADSYGLLPNSLDALGKDFECETLKGKFCYSFVNESTINYVGKTPDKFYFEGISNDAYELIRKEDWSLKEETLKYLEKDLDCLLEVMSKFNKYIFITHDLQMSECLTISRLSLNLFRKKYLGDKKIPLITKPSMFNFIKLGYYGGITEVYKPYGKDLYFYDVNSEYPFVAKNILPGNRFNYIEDKKGEGLDLNELFGFFYCKVKTNDSYLGFLPVHQDGALILPNGTFYGIWFSEELKYAKEKGYEITVLKGYNFNQVESVFTDYVDKLYDIKSNSKGMIKAITKLLLNSTFGRFGMNINKSISEIVNKDKLDLILSSHEVNGIKELNENTFIVSYNSELSNSVSERSGLDIIKLLEKKNNRDYEHNYKVEDVSITTAAAITAYARIHINKLKQWVLLNQGSIYYSDTDSIVTNLKLPDNFVNKMLGGLKLEYKVKEGFFISSKTYYLLLENGEEIKKCKGVLGKKLHKKDFEAMYWENKNIIGEKSVSLLNYKEGYVNINIKNIVLNYNSYTKREKLYENGVWVDTKPITYKPLD